jgi:hypothetical protein
LPTVLQDGPYRFIFYSGDRTERPHVPVEPDGNEAKFWIDTVALERNQGFGKAEINRIEALVQANAGLLVREWHEYLGN